MSSLSAIYHYASLALLRNFLLACFLFQLKVRRNILIDILMNKLRVFDKEYLFRFVQMTPKRFDHLRRW